MNPMLLKMIALAGSGVLLAACVTFPPPGSMFRTTDADMLAADEMTRAGNYNGAESLLLAGRSSHPRHTTAWRAYTLKTADITREAGQIDKACAYRFETNPGEVVHLPDDRSDLDPVGPRKRRLAEAIAASERGDYAAAAEGFDRLRRDLDPVCPSWLAVTAAQMAAALRAGAIPSFMALGGEMDSYFGDWRIVLAKEEDGPIFNIYATYRAMAGKPLPLNTPAALQDRLAFFAGNSEEGGLR